LLHRQGEGVNLRYRLNGEWGCNIPDGVALVIGSHYCHTEQLRIDSRKNRDIVRVFAPGFALEFLVGLIDYGLYRLCVGGDRTTLPGRSRGLAGHGKRKDSGCTTYRKNGGHESQSCVEHVLLPDRASNARLSTPFRLNDSGPMVAVVENFVQ